MENIQTAQQSIQEAVTQGAQVVLLPEIWNSPYATDQFPVHAEEIPSDATQCIAEKHPSSAMMIEMAKKYNIYLVGGSIPERENDQVFNTCVVISPEGNIIAKHRKMHLFDIDVPGRITFKESDTLSAGNEVVVFETPYCKIGLGICYDIRFPELSQLLRNKGAELLLFPGAFNLTTGPAHWELLQRARAVDNQLYVATASPARGPEGGYQAWGHSSIINPWGEVIATCDAAPAIVSAVLDLEKVTEMRQNIPTSLQKRHDIYQLQAL